MFGHRRPSTATTRYTDSSQNQSDGRGHRPKHRDSPSDKRRIDLTDLDSVLTGRDLVNVGVKESWNLNHVVALLRKRFPDGDTKIPKDAEVQFFSVDKRLEGRDIPGGVSSLLYRVLPSGDDDSLQIIWQGTGLKLRKSDIEAISQEVTAGGSVGKVRETTANLLKTTNKSKEHLIRDANQVVVEAAGGLRSGPLEGNNWETNKVRKWLCRYLTINLNPIGSYLVLRGFNEQYICHKPCVNNYGYVDVLKLKTWLKDDVLASVHSRKPRRRGISTEDIRLTYRGRLLRRSNHIRFGETIDFEVPRVIEDSFIRNEAWLLPFSETCIVCSDEKRVSEMPNKRRITAACEHDASICKACVGLWIASSLETSTWDRLKCPECPQLLKFENVRAFATREVFDRYDILAAKALLTSIPEFIWCLNPRCDSGQIYPAGCERAKCHACKHYLCVHHNVPWHRGETCADYDRRTRKQRKNDQASEKHVKETSKPCPGCQRNIHKYTGCDHVTCVCGHEWCWLCFGTYYRDGRDFLQCHHTRECRYHDNPPNYEGGRVFMPFINVNAPPPPPFMQDGPLREGRANIPNPDRFRGFLPRLRGPGPANMPHIPDADLAEHFLRRDRNPFNPNLNINPARARPPDPQPRPPEPGPGFFQDALLFNLGHLVQRAERER